MPLTIFWFIFAAGLIFFLLKIKRAAIICCILSIIWMVIISLPFLPDHLVKSLEKRYPPLISTSQFDTTDSVYIFVLGAGYTENLNLPSIDQLSQNSLCRLSEALRLHILLKTSLLVLDGSPGDNQFRKSEIFKNTAISLGVEENEIRVLGNPANTRMEATDFTTKFGTNNTLILVTDAIHMPRAMFLFQKAGQKPIPAPTNHLIKSASGMDIHDWVPSALNIYKIEYAMHEIIGSIWAKFTYKFSKKN